MHMICQWYSVFATDYFSIAVAVHYAGFGQGTVPVFLKYVSCTGTESSLLSCSHGGIGVACSHSHDFGVVCPPGEGYTVKPLITDPLKSGQHLYSGRLTCPRLILP